MNATTIRPSEGFDYYKQNTIYWNTFEAIRAHQSTTISGNPAIGWVRHLKEKYGVRNCGLFVSCGNGWVERDCYKAGLIKEAYGFDVIPELVDSARKSAAEIGLPSTYVVADGNNLSLDRSNFDLIVNNGSMHHIAYIDALLRKLRNVLPDDGHYVIHDYTGSHRNQYPWEVFSRIVEVNASLPPEYRVQLGYAHMPTMLHLDPTEAIHSELQMDVTRRYFDIIEEAQFGGGIAYTLLYQNQALHRDRETEKGKKVLQHIISADADLLKSLPASNLFTFAICRPKKTLPDQGVLDRWTAEENEREAAAARNGGRYYPPTTLELIYQDLSDARYKIRVLEKQLADAQNG